MKRKSKLPILAIFLGPSAVLIGVFYFVPVVLTLFISFTDMGRRLEWNFIGTTQFSKLFAFENPIILKVIGNTIVYTALSLPLTIIGGLAIALLTARIRPAAGLFFRALFFLPRMIPPVVWGFLWIWAFEGNKTGLVNQVLSFIAIDPIPFLSRYGMLVVVLANAFLGMALTSLIFSSALAAIPQDLFRAAEADGATEWQQTRHVTLPALRWPIMTMTAWHLMSFMNSYVYILLITGGGPWHSTEVWSLFIYNTAFEEFRYGLGAAMTMVLVVVNVALLAILLKIFGFKKLATRGMG